MLIRNMTVDEVLAENGKLRAALKLCVDTLDSEAMMDAWKFLYAHGYVYTGPSVSMVQMRKVLNDEQAANTEKSHGS